MNAIAPSQVPAAPDTDDAGRDLRTVARGGLLNMVGAGGNAVFTFLIFVVIARAVDLRQVGALLVAIAAFTILTTGSQFGAQVGLVRMIARYRVLGRVSDIRHTLLVGLTPVLVTGAAMAAAGYALAGQFAALLGRGEDAELVVRYLHLLVPFIPFAALLAVAAGATQGFGTMLPAVAVDKLGRTVTQLGLTVLTVSLGSVAIALAWATPYALGLVAISGWLVVLLRRTERQASGDPARPLPQLAREFWRFSAPRGVASFFQVSVLWFDTILLGVLRSTQEAGIYAVATRYLTIGHLVIGAILQVTGPKLSELLAAKSQDRASSVYQAATCWVTALVWPVYFTVGIFAPFLLQVFGREFVAGQTALLILAGAMLIAAVSGPVDVVLLMGGKSWWSLVNWGMAFVVNVVLNLVLIPSHGINGAAIAWAVSILVRNLIPVVEVWLLMGLHPVGEGLRKVMVASTVSYGVVGVVLRSAFGASLTTFALLLAVGTTTYAAMLWRHRDVVLGKGLTARRATVSRD
ncbi:MAG: oligosaccharide flippase family protein [Euzebyaceae bacterium]|nr:oligosaccharide flippase family protein [Euzebyaceae bacterium]